MNRRTLAGLAVAVMALPTVALIGASPALAATSATDGGVKVVNTETVQAYLDPTGRLDVARVYEQVAMKGRGTVDLKNPVETDGLRNLDGFGGFDVQDGVLVGRYEVDGEQHLRTVSDYTKKLPLEVSVVYLLDGTQVQPDELLGRSGRLEVRYTVRNVTGTPQVVTYADGSGGQASVTKDVVIPMVGSLSTVLPETFTNVQSTASTAGDGRGGTKLTFTMTLFGPIGTPEATFGYTADVVDGTLPKANISALPVSPLESPSFKAGAESYKGGAGTGAELTAGATEIDTNLLKLRDGAGTLLAGLIQLRDGARQLDAGLGAQALPGSQELAAGAGKLKDGTSQLRDGAAQAKDGSAQVANGAGRVADGAKRLSGGAAQVDAGAALVAGGLHLVGDKAPELVESLALVADGLDKVDAGLTAMYDSVGELPTKAQPLHAGLAKLRAGLGAKGQANTLIDGVDQVRSGLAAATAAGGSLDLLLGGVGQAKAGAGALKTGVEQAKGGVDQSKGGVDQSKGGVDQSKGGVDQVKTGLDGALASGGGLDQLDGGVALAKATGCDATCQGILAQVQVGLADLRTKTGTASGGLGQVSTGLGQVSTGLGQVSTGLGQVSGGLGQASTGLGTLGTGLGQVEGGLGQVKTSLSAAALGLARVECGLSNTTLVGICDPKTPGLLEGVDLVDAGVTTLVNGVVGGVQGGIGTPADAPADATLRGGINGLQGGIDLIGLGGLDLLDALDQLGAGADKVSGGTSQVAKGARDLAAGSAQLADGAGRLDAGLGDLSDGAGRLDAGAGRLSDGAGRLSSGLADAASGTSRLAAGLGEAAAKAPALQSGAQRLSDEGTKKLVEAGKGVAVDFGEKYALLEVGARRAKAEGMAYGAPTGAVGATAYSLEIAGVTGDGKANAGRAAAAIGAFALTGGGVLLRRRFI